MKKLKNSLPNWVVSLDAFESIERIEDKLTARSAKKCFANVNADEYLLEWADTKIPCYYLNRSITLRSQIIDTFGTAFSYNHLHLTVQKQKKVAAIYKKINGLKCVRDAYPVEVLTGLYNDAEVQTSTPVLIELVLDGFLSAWPVEWHAVIRSLPGYGAFLAILEKLPELQCIFEHGDFTTNNIYEINGDYFLFDFEFCKSQQVIGFDLYDYLVSIGKVDQYKQDIPFLKLNTIKYDLIMHINKLLDSNVTGIVEYNGFHEGLTHAWRELTVNSPAVTYNLDHDWCEIWMRTFGENYHPRIIGYWDEGKLQALIPLYLYKKSLRLMGTYPDLFDQGGALYLDEFALKKLLEYLVHLPEHLDLKYLPSDKFVFTSLSRSLVNAVSHRQIEIADVNPLVDLNNYKPSKKIRDDVKRCINNFEKAYGDGLHYFQNVKEDSALQAFFDMHIKRWSGGPFEELPGLQVFITRLQDETNLIRIDKLANVSGDLVAAWHMGYQNNERQITSAIPAFNFDFSKYSPGKVLLYKMIESAVEDTQVQEKRYFDFGRGAEDYKYWFSSEELVLMNIRVYKNMPLLDIWNKLKRLVVRWTIG